MKIVHFQEKHIEEAKKIIADNYRMERSFTPDLPVEPDFLDLRALAQNALGVAAFEDGKMVGVLCCYSPFACAFGATDVTGIFSPMGANGVVGENRARVFGEMYREAAAKWVRAGAVSHGICLYSHDRALQQEMYWQGFGLRCVDGIRPMERIHCRPCQGYRYEELQKSAYEQVYPLALALHQHCCKSPCFMNRTPKTREEFVASSLSGADRYFAAFHNGEICAYIKISTKGETFAAAGDAYRHIDGAYCLPEHRGAGVYQNLMNAAIDVLKKEGFKTLGVDFESFNPTGRAFWSKYFALYTHGVVRRIDERITGLY